MNECECHYTFSSCFKSLIINDFFISKNVRWHKFARNMIISRAYYIFAFFKLPDCHHISPQLECIVTLSVFCGYKFLFLPLPL